MARRTPDVRPECRFGPVTPSCTNPIPWRQPGTLASAIKGPVMAARVALQEPSVLVKKRNEGNAHSFQFGLGTLARPTRWLNYSFHPILLSGRLIVVKVKE